MTALELWRRKLQKEFEEEMNEMDEEERFWELVIFTGPFALTNVCSRQLTKKWGGSRPGRSANDMAKGKGKKATATDSHPSRRQSARPNAGKNEDAVVDIEEGDGGSGTESPASKKRPQCAKQAKLELKRQKQQEDAFNMSAQAQTELAATSKARVKILAEKSLINLLTMPTDQMEPKLRDFMKAWKLEEIAKLKDRMQPIPHSQQVISETQQGGNEADNAGGGLDAEDAGFDGDASFPWRRRVLKCNMTVLNRFI